MWNSWFRIIFWCAPKHHLHSSVFWTWPPRCSLKVFKIGISKVSGSALVAEICADPHNRLLRRQHCSSLCSQSEGHEHVANMTNALGHYFVGFSVLVRHNIRPLTLRAKWATVLRPRPPPNVRAMPLAAMPHSLARQSGSRRSIRGHNASCECWAASPTKLVFSYFPSSLHPAPCPHVLLS